MCVYVGQYAKAQTFLEECIHLCRLLGDRRLEVAALQPLSMACLGFAQFGDAEAHLNHALQLTLESGNRSFQAYIENTIGQLLRVSRRFGESMQRVQTARMLAVSLGDLDLEAVTCLNESMTLLDRDAELSVGPACVLLDRVLGYCQRSGSHALVQSALDVSCALAGMRGSWSDAAEYWSWAEAMAKHSGLRRDPADEAFIRPHVEALEAAFGAALLRHRIQNADVQPPAVVIARLQTWLGELTHAEPA
jgi:hypothetical protein